MKKIGLLLSLFLIVGCGNIPNIKKINVEQAKKVYEQEFDGSYAYESNPNGNLVEFEIEAKEREFVLINGEKTKTWGYTDTAAPLELRIKLGDTIRVNFKNSLPDETTIHWHGVRVPNAMDGVPGVNQKAIESGENFVYEFTPKNAGTFWFHPHVRGSEQLERGLKGVLIVDESESLNFSQDVTWVLDDWFLTRDLQIRPTFNTPHELMHDGRWGNVVTINGKQAENLSAKVGERIRLRLIDVANARVFKPVLENFSADVFERDGMRVGEILPYKSTEIAPGNRIDLDILITPKMAGKSLIIRNDYMSTAPLGVINVSELNEQIETPQFEIPLAKMPAWKDIQNLPVDQTFELNASRRMVIKDGRSQSQIVWMINNKIFSEADPVTLEKGALTIVEYKNLTSRIHPMHLHGQFFRVIDRNGKGEFEPFWRDTLLIKRNETIRVALMPTDTGTWAHHCHILEHAEAGMMNLIEVQEFEESVLKVE